jgi:hypothetical protein
MLLAGSKPRRESLLVVGSHRRGTLNAHDLKLWIKLKCKRGEKSEPCVNSGIRCLAWEGFSETTVILRAL